MFAVTYALQSGEKDSSEGYGSHVTLPSSPARKITSQDYSSSDCDSVDQEENFAKIHGLCKILESAFLQEAKLSC